MNPNNKKILMMVGIAIFVLVLIFGAYSIFNKPKVETKVDDSKFAEAEDDLAVIPTVTKDVIVELVSIDPKKEIGLEVSGVPSGTKSLEYELTYSTQDQDSQGVFSTAAPDKGKLTFGTTFERKITLGTCSRNVCKYHILTSPIQVSIKFEGDYGARLFQKSYDVANL